MSEFFGKYRGRVEANRDPQNMGRVQVSVASVLGESTLSWAMPSAPYAGSDVGLFVIPPVGAHVWVEFERGDPDYPIWSGCFWEEGSAPGDSPDKKVLKTDTGTITIDDTAGSGGITIETSDGKKIVINSSGIEINAGQGTITIDGSQVSINNGALEVT